MISSGRLKLSILAIPLLISMTHAEGPTTISEHKSITLEGAQRVLNAALAEAMKNKVGGAIAVVDDAGNLVSMARLDGTFPISSTISVGKARTAAVFRKPTKFFEDTIAKGRTAMVSLNDFTPLQGGVPIVVDGQVIGAIGVSGASSAQQDEDIAIVGAKALEKTASTVEPSTKSEALHNTQREDERVVERVSPTAPITTCVQRETGKKE